MKRFLTIFLACVGAAVLVLILNYFLFDPAKEGLAHDHNPYGLQSDSSQEYLLTSSQEYQDSLMKHMEQARKSIWKCTASAGTRGR